MYTQLNLKRIEVFIGSQSVDCYKRFNISKDGMRAKTPMLQLSTKLLKIFWIQLSLQEYVKIKFWNIKRIILPTNKSIIIYNNDKFTNL